MSVSVSMPQLGESVTEGTVTRWLKKEGERVEVDEPLLEVSTDKVDTEIPSPASGILRGITVDEDETVAVGAQLAVIDDGESSDSAPAADDSADAAPAETAQPEAPARRRPSPGNRRPEAAQPEAAQPEQAPAASSDGWGSQPNYAPPVHASASASPGYSGSSGASTPAYAPPPAYGQPQPSASLPGSLTGSHGQQAQPTTRLRPVRCPRRASRPRTSPARRLRLPRRPRPRSTRRPRRCRARATHPT